MISIENLSLRRNSKLILKDVCWNVGKGEHWCLLGLNGSGKTSLLNVINGYLFPTSGKVEVFGRTFGETNLPELRKEIGWVSSSIQQQFRDDDIVLRIVLSGKFASIGLYEQVSEEDLQLAFHFMKLLKCDELQYENYGVLSQGERQRVLIARALMAKPRLLILDEPCTGLDLIAREELLQFVERIATEKNGPTLIFVTHHVEEVLPCLTHTMLLKEGEVFEQGLSKDLLTESVLTNFFNRPLSVQFEQKRIWVALKDCVNENR